jgi:hypothetical protein
MFLNLYAIIIFNMPEYKKQYSEITCDFSINRLKILRQKRLFTNDNVANRRYSFYYLSKINENSTFIYVFIELM